MRLKIDQKRNLKVFIQTMADEYAAFEYKKKK